MSFDEFLIVFLAVAAGNLMAIRVSTGSAINALREAAARVLEIADKNNTAFSEKLRALSEHQTQLAKAHNSFTNDLNAVLEVQDKLVERTNALIQDKFSTEFRALMGALSTAVLEEGKYTEEEWVALLNSLSGGELDAAVQP